ncbi:MAG: carbamoyltransferase HypF [Cyanobacteriota bacterium]|jgi:hydrogenase maturation protein HypF
MRYRVTVEGRVQGVGFRPFAYRLAQRLGLGGWAQNTGAGAELEIEGERERLETFLQRLKIELPPPGRVERLGVQAIPSQGETTFQLRASAGGEKRAIVLPDLATCSDCLREIFAPQNRRYRYPFTNCTHCGPRYSIIAALPYDRPQTTMKDFPLCEDCQSEYENPGDRRFHAQPNACPQCGPQVEFWSPAGDCLAQGEAALSLAVKTLELGQILAVKGLGGFHLWVGAGDESAVARLRERKRRPHKPLAVMFPGLTQIQENCELSQEAADLLTSPAAPIVLLPKKPDVSLAPNLAPGIGELGAMLPYTPLHWLLLTDFPRPVVATSGNGRGEPICIDNAEALTRLGDIADGFLVHNRPILRPVDDSVTRIIDGHPQVLRRARGYAPIPLPRGQSGPTLLAVGGHLKNTVALALNEQIYLSQHIGDLDNPETDTTFRHTLASLTRLYGASPQKIIHDRHPDYQSTTYAQGQSAPTFGVQHHLAHVLAVMAEHSLQPPVLGLAWDGAGWGLDGTLWGGEFLRIEPAQWYRVAHFHPFPLLGGAHAMREPPRVSLALLNCFDREGLPPTLQDYFSPWQLRQLQTLYQRRLNSLLTSSVGRLFDGAAALLGLVGKISFEGQGAMLLEAQIGDLETEEAYPFTLDNSPVLPWRPWIEALAQDPAPLNLKAAKFHNTLVNLALQVCQGQGLKQIVLSGGVFQNRYLLTRLIRRLQGLDFQVYWPQEVPPNDGGLALGQIAAADRYDLG